MGRSWDRRTFALLQTFPVVAALAALLQMFAAGPARAQSDDDRERQARTHFAAGEYREARDIYARLYADTLHPTYLRNIGRCYQNLHDSDRAISSFREYLRKHKNIDAEERAEVEGFIRDLEGERSRVASAPPAATAPPPAVVASAGTQREPVYKRWWFWTGVATVVVAGTVMVATGAFTSKRDAGCPPELRMCQ